MRQTCFLILTIFIFSCKKDNEMRSLKKEIVGTWEIEKFIGYPFTQPPYPPGNGQIIVIGDNGDFERRKHDTLVFKGHYSMRRKKDCYPGDKDIIFLTNESS